MANHDCSPSKCGPDLVLRALRSDQGFLARLLRLMEAGDDSLEEVDVMSQVSSASVRLLCLEHAGSDAKQSGRQRQAVLRAVALRCQALTMVLAGYETTSATLASAVYALTQHPEAQARAQQELDAALGGKVRRLRLPPSARAAPTCAGQACRFGRGATALCVADPPAPQHAAGATACERRRKGMRSQLMCVHTQGMYVLYACTRAAGHARGPGAAALHVGYL